MQADDSAAEEEFLKAESERLGKFANEIAATMLHEHRMECSQSDVECIESSLWSLAEFLNEERNWSRSAATHKKALLAQFRSARQLSGKLGSLLSSEGFSSAKGYLSWVYGRDVTDYVKEYWGDEYSYDEKGATEAWILDHERGLAKNGNFSSLIHSIFELDRASKLLIEALEKEAPRRPANITRLVVETMIPVYWDVFPHGRIGGTGNGKYPRRGPLYTFVGTAGRLFGLKLSAEAIRKTIERFDVPMHGKRSE